MSIFLLYLIKHFILRWFNKKRIGNTGIYLVNLEELGEHHGDMISVTAIVEIKEFVGDSVIVKFNEISNLPFSLNKDEIIKELNIRHRIIPYDEIIWD